MIANYYWKKQCLSKKQCELLIKKGREGRSWDSYVYNRRKEDEVIDKSYRSSKTGIFLEETDPSYNDADSEDVRTAINSLYIQFRQIAFDYYRFPILSFEPIQFTNYLVNDFFVWHTDAGSSPAPNLENVSKMGSHRAGDRDLSASVILTPKDEYDGGGLELLLPNIDGEIEQVKIAEEQGLMIMFPSTLIHQVSKLTKGQRSSLVIWGYRN